MAEQSPRPPSGDGDPEPGSVPPPDGAPPGEASPGAPIPPSFPPPGGEGSAGVRDQPSHPPSGEAEEEVEEAEPEEEPPLDADDTRGAHLRFILAHPFTLSLGTTVAVAVFSILVVLAGPIPGAAGGLAVVAIAFAIAWVLATRWAAEDFFGAYAEERGLSREKEGSLPPATPLLRRGERRHAEEIMRGELPGGLTGTLALYTYEVDSRDSKGDRHTAYHDFTVVLADLPETAFKVSGLYCQRRVGPRLLDGAEDVFRRKQRLELESEDLDRDYEIFHDPNTDENWLRQLFAPSFIVWLAEQAPPDFAFELTAGALCVDVEDHMDSAEELDDVCEAAAVVAARLRGETAE
jgi:hypothetical protein